MISFGILRIFGEKNRKKGKVENLGKTQAHTPQCREPTSRCSPTPQRQMPHHGEAEVLKRAPPRYATALPSHVAAEGYTAAYTLFTARKF